MNEFYRCHRCDEASSIRFSRVSIRGDLAGQLTEVGWTLETDEVYPYKIVLKIVCPDCTKEER